MFFGGGTPSLLPPISWSASSTRSRATDAEVTVECNPDSGRPGELAAYRSGGVTRVSFGVQSMSRTCSRSSNARTTPPTWPAPLVGRAPAGFDTFNLDLIYGTPGESLDDWRATLDGALALAPPHVSAYALTVEPGTPLGQRVARGRRPRPMTTTRPRSTSSPTTGSARRGSSGTRCRTGRGRATSAGTTSCTGPRATTPVVGCGPRARPRAPLVERPHPGALRRAGRCGASAEAGAEVLDEGTRRDEAFLLALRTRGGVPVGAAARTRWLVSSTPASS